MTDAHDCQTLSLRLAVPAIAGLLIGLEREQRGRDAGLRTRALIAFSSAAITVSALIVAQDQPPDRDSFPVRAVQGIAQAVWLLAGGLIFARGSNVPNMTTAASLWVSAAIGSAAAAGQFGLTLLLGTATLMVLAIVGLTERSIPQRFGNTTRRSPADTWHQDRAGPVPTTEGRDR